MFQSTTSVVYYYVLLATVAGAEWKHCLEYSFQQVFLYPLEQKIKVLEVYPYLPTNIRLVKTPALTFNG